MRECNCSIVVTKLYGVLRTAISHTQCTIEGYAGTDHHTVVGAHRSRYIVMQAMRRVMYCYVIGA